MNIRIEFQYTNNCNLGALVKNSSSRNFLFIFIIIVIAVSVRHVYLNGDAPVSDISRSGVFYVDEGTYAHNVINKILFDEWFIENDYNAIANIPVFSVCQYFILKITGISLKSLRITGIIYSMLFLLLLWFLIKQYNLKVANTAIVLGAINYFYIIYNRLALLENLLVLFLIIITINLYFYYKKHSLLYLIIAIFLFWSGYFIKATILFFLPLMLLTILVRPVNGRVKLRDLWIYFSISSIFLLIAYFYWVKPHNFDFSYFESRNIHRMITVSFTYFLENYARYFFNLKLFQFMPVIYSIYIFYISYLLYELFLKRKLEFIDWFFLGWSICGMLFLGFFQYSPPRFSLILIPAILVLTSNFLYKLVNNNLNFSNKKSVFLFAPAIILSLCQICFGFYRIIQYKQNYMSCYFPLISIIILVILYLISKYKVNKIYIAYLLFGSIILLHSIQIVNYYKNIRFSYYHAMQDMKKVIQAEQSDNNILFGDVAALVSSELKMKAVNINFRSDTESVRILNNKPNFLILQEKDELPRLTEKLPGYLQDVELLKTYKIFNNYRNNDDTYFYKIDINNLNKTLFAKKKNYDPLLY